MTTDEEILYPSSDGDYYCGDSEETPNEQEPLSPAPVKVCTEPVITIMPRSSDVRKAKGNRQITFKDVKN